MILFLETHKGGRVHYKINSMSDLEAVYRDFPQARTITMYSSSLSEAVENIAEYLSSYHVHAWIDGQEIAKSIKDKAMALGLAISAIASPIHAGVSELGNQYKTGSSIVHHTDKFGTKPVDRFLWTVSQIESSGGKNMNHQQIKYGKYRGETAIGKWGLLKPTVKEIISRMRLDGSLTPDTEKLETMSRDQLSHHFSRNPHIELKLARYLADHVINRQKGDLHRAAYSWLMGHNKFPDSISHEDIRGSDYVQKFKQFDKHNPLKSKFKTKPKVKQVITTQVAMKSESPTDFRQRVKNWGYKREQELNSHKMKQTNDVEDLGRIRDKKLDEIKSDSQMNDIDKLKNKIKESNEV